MTRRPALPNSLFVMTRAAMDPTQIMTQIKDLRNNIKPSKILLMKLKKKMRVSSARLRMLSLSLKNGRIDREL